MSTSAFADKSTRPRAEPLAATLGRASGLWQALVDGLASEFAPLSQSWKYGGQQWGWALQLRQRKRTVVYLTPCRGYFIAGFALGERAVEAARRADLPSSVLAAIESARKYAEGRAVRLDVRTKRDVGAVRRIAATKMAT